MRANNLLYTRFRLLERSCIGNTNKTCYKAFLRTCADIQLVKNHLNIFTDIKTTPFALKILDLQYTAITLLYELFHTLSTKIFCLSFTLAEVLSVFLHFYNFHLTKKKAAKQFYHTVLYAYYLYLYQNTGAQNTSAYTE